MGKLWGGRFAGRPDPQFESFQRSLPFDWRLWREDLQGSAAWTRALVGAGVLTAREGRRLVAALRALERDLARAPERIAAADAEDVHSFVETELGKRVGDLARKLHTGRSRNDQVATDLKLWLERALERLDGAAAALQRALVALAERHAADPMPGYTHLQRAQPITIGHHALAYVEMLGRDRGRLADARARFATCPLGSGALAGTAYRIDREFLAKELGFAGGPTRNSLDAVSDRDHVVEVAFACAVLLTHLSRFAEDWIFFASQEAAFLQLGDDVTTGSSLMPQKKNPDALELIRGKTGRVAGRLQGLLCTLKGLPLAYDKDLQEDKEALFEALDTTEACVRVATLVVQSARFDVARCASQCARGYLNATDLADLLVHAGVPFRTAHERAGRAVRRALELGVELENLPADERRTLLPELQADFAPLLATGAVLARRAVIGGTAPARVRDEARRWRRALAPSSRRVKR
jgi:argininosuccinate lyase